MYFHLIICIFLKIQIVISENKSDILFDQRQTGKYNIHFSIKDVAIIELGANKFFDDTNNDKDDYYYDEDDLTIKPWFSTSTKNPIINSSSILVNDTNNLSTSAIYVTTIKNDVNVLNPKETATITAVTNLNIQSNITTLSPPIKKRLSINEPQDIPVQIIMEPVLIPKLRKPLHKLPSQRNTDSRIVRLETNHHPLLSRLMIRCNNNGGFLDENGNCRPKRSTTIKSLFLKKMFNIFKELTMNKINRDTSST